MEVTIEDSDECTDRITSRVQKQIERFQMFTERRVLLAEVHDFRSHAPSLPYPWRLRDEIHPDAPTCTSSRRLLCHV